MDKANKLTGLPVVFLARAAPEDRSCDTARYVGTKFACKPSQYTDR